MIQQNSFQHNWLNPIVSMVLMKLESLVQSRNFIEQHPCLSTSFDWRVQKVNQRPVWSHAIYLRYFLHDSQKLRWKTYIWTGGIQILLDVNGERQLKYCKRLFWILQKQAVCYRMTTSTNISKKWHFVTKIFSRPLPRTLNIIGKRR